MSSNIRPIGIFHEHPDWFRPLFAELERRGIPYEKIDARHHLYDPRESGQRYSLVVNRMSPSAYLRGAGQGIFHTLNYLGHLERRGIPIVNGSEAYPVEISKALQLEILEELGLPYPAARIINHPEQAVAAAEGLRFPVVVKPNIGGSGAGIVRFDTPGLLSAAVHEGRIDLGIDQVGLVQEYIPARGGHITRVETLDQRYLYAINVYNTGAGFNLCPADICQTTDGVELSRGACPADAPKTGIRVESFTPSADVIAAVERIVTASAIDVGGIEYVVDDRDGRVLYYDINALSNFVADATRVVGFDPHARLVDYLERRARPEPLGARPDRVSAP
ncbi:MAG: ATP-grasp domain-containing protein [Blastocatellia bacterium]